jgi:iron complex outermembrane receptor protein
MVNQSLLEGYGIRTIADIHAVSAALFGQLDWQVTDYTFYRACYNYMTKGIELRPSNVWWFTNQRSTIMAIKEQCTPTKPSLQTKTSLTFSGNITVNYKANKWRYLC